MEKGSLSSSGVGGAKSKFARINKLKELELRMVIMLLLVFIMLGKWDVK